MLHTQNADRGTYENITTTYRMLVSSAKHKTKLSCIHGLIKTKGQRQPSDGKNACRELLFP